MAIANPLMTLALGAVMAASTLAPANANVNAGPETSGPNQTADNQTQVAINKIIRIGPRRNALRTWRCAVTLDGNRYYSTGVTETGARAQLAEITDQRFHCRRDRRRMFS